MKRYINLALIYAIVAMVFGVFYREFTKAYGFTGKTNLAVMHTHYFLLGMFFFLALLALEKCFSFSAQKNTGLFLIIYQVGLNITGLGFLIRGLTQVWGTALSTAQSAAISGLSGTGHILLGVSMVLILLKIRRSAAVCQEAA